MTDSIPLPQVSTTSSKVNARLSPRQAAEKLEATFLSEMLKSTGFGKQNHGFSGGIGEDQFSSFQRDALAKEMVQRGGIGLAEVFFNAMTKGTKINE